MFGSAAVDVAVGLFAVYFLLSIICLQLTEYIAGVIGLRSRLLRRGVRALLLTESFREGFWQHPLIETWSGGRSAPSYLSSKTFALAVLDVAAPEKAADLESLLSSLRARAKVGDRTARALLTIVEPSRDIATVRKGISVWFDDAMDRVSGSYKRRIQVIAFVVAAVVTLIVGADTFAFTNTLWTNQGLVSSLATTAVTGEETLDAAVDALGTFEIPFGWIDWPYDAFSWGYKIVGLLVTTMAVSFGASFWFDVFKRISNVRSAGPAPLDARHVPQGQSSN